MGAFCLVRAGLAALLVAVSTPASALDVQVLKSPGGVRFWFVHETTVPIVVVNAGFDGGSRTDPAGKEGLAGFVAAMLDKGAGDLDSSAFFDAADRLSAHFGFGAGKDRLNVDARMLARSVDASVALLAQALTRPRFDPQPTARVRARIEAGIAQSREDPAWLAARTWFADAFPGHPYGRPQAGTADSIAAITRDDLLAAHARLLTRANAHLVIVGDVDAAHAGRLADKMLGGLPEGRKVVPVHFDAPPPPGLTVLPMDVPQSVAIFGEAGLGPHDPDFIAAQVMLQILGSGGMTSRLMTEIRIKRGLAYGVSVGLGNDDEADYLLGEVRSRNAKMAETLKILRAEFRRMARSGVTADELDSAKRYLTGSYPLQFDTDGKIAGYLLDLQLAGYPPDFIDRHNALIEAVTLADIKRVAKRLLHADRLSIVVAGKPIGLPQQP